MAPSPDGRKLYVDGFDNRGELIRYDAASRQFVPYLSGISAGELDFSRDGKWVTYVSYPDGSLWRCRTDGSDKLQLTYPPISAVLPRWSPVGSQIAFVDEESGKLWKIMLIPSDGGTPTELYADRLNQADPSWSPDGKRLLFARFPPAGTTDKLDIRLLDLASHQVSVIACEEGLLSPRWSPDGQHILAVTENSKKLMLYDMKNSQWSEWINEPGAVAFPAWSPDGSYVYFGRVSTAEPSFRRVRVGENHSELLIDLKRFAAILQSHWPLERNHTRRVCASGAKSKHG
jgi:Tol biopolymer transport system component